MNPTSDRDAIRLFVGFSPGSASDIVSQALIPELSKALQRPIHIERHIGSNGAVAASLACRAPPDGNTLMIVTLGTHVIAPVVRSDLPYHALNDFVPIALLARAPLVLAANPGLGVETVADLIARGREAKEPLTFGSSGMWGAPHLGGELFSHLARVPMRHVVYQLTAQLYADLVSGQIATSVNNIMSMHPLIRAGKLRGLATTGSTRSPILPELPTLVEAGVAAYELVNWVGICAPAGTPAHIANDLASAVAAAINSPAAGDLLASKGMEIAKSSPEAFAAQIKKEQSDFSRLVAGIKGAGLD